MATRHYESNTSGMNFDRFLDKFDESTLVTMKRHYWTAKQLLRTKLGKKEDEHLQASDASLDSKLTLFRSVRSTSESLLACIENYQGLLLDSTLCENELGRYLKDQGKADKREDTGRMMVALGRALMFSSHQRAAVRVPLIRFYQELQVFTERAIFDCAQTVEAVERARLEYRGSLLWMKKTSEELDPDTDRQLEKFREAQSAVRVNKEKLDKLKVDTLQKVDLLSASRSNLLSHLLGKYLDMLCAFYERTCRAYSALSANLSTFQHYDFEILTDLIEPSKKVARTVRHASMEKEAREAEYARVANEEEVEEPIGNLLNFDEEPEGSLKKYLFGRESPLEAKVEEAEEERTESPLGLLDLEAEPVGSDPQQQQQQQQPNMFHIGPLPPLIDTEAEVPLLTPPPRAPPTQPLLSIARPSSHVDHNTDESGYSVQDLFPLVGQTKQAAPSQDSIIDLLGAPSSQFPNPFDENKTTEWDLLLSQCDIQQSSDLI